MTDEEIMRKLNEGPTYFIRPCKCAYLRLVAEGKREAKTESERSERVRVHGDMHRMCEKINCPPDKERASL